MSTQQVPWSPKRAVICEGGSLEAPKDWIRIQEERFDSETMIRAASSHYQSLAEQLLSDSVASEVQASHINAFLLATQLLP